MNNDRQAAAGAEVARLAADVAGRERWKAWGPYLAERAWGTVREDYSADGDAWSYFPHDMARSRAYRWNEDGLLGISDDQGRLCLALALWNGRDPILKERLFGLGGHEGNHGEDVKERYAYLDCTPTHSYMRAVYHYPQAEFPYARLVEENRRRTRLEPEFELLDSGVFGEDRYWQVEVEYAKASPRDIIMRVQARNCGPEAAELHLLPQLWFRNFWSWGDAGAARPRLRLEAAGAITVEHPRLRRRWLAFDPAAKALFCENETNFARLFGGHNTSPTAKDGVHDRVVGGREDATGRAEGSKVALWHRFTVQPGASASVRVRLSVQPPGSAPQDAEALIELRRAECDDFFAALHPPTASPDLRLVQRRALAGLLWSKQFYHYDVPRWLTGDPAGPPPPAARHQGRNHGWETLNNADVLSMPDKWEYPWFAAWDLALQALPLALVDADFAKSQLILLTREWYQHPNGQLPAYEWAFSDVDPPVHAWAAWRVYSLERDRTGRADRAFLEAVFHKLLLNFTWWVNRKDSAGRNVFEGGFLGLDNVSLFDRSGPLPGGGQLEQADGTAWMGMYCLTMMRISLELARADPVYENMATKFFEHFLYIAGALNDLGGSGVSLWDATDEFYYDCYQAPDGTRARLRVRSLVGLIPLLAVETLEPEELSRFPGFRRRLDWMLTNRPQLAALVPRWTEPGGGDRRLLALTHGHRMKRVLARMLDESEFLSPYGVRSLSRAHLAKPFSLELGGRCFSVGYEPAESTTGTFGGNSNWRGPVWFPINYLLIEALNKLHAYYSDDFRVECPTGSGTLLSLREVAGELSRRLIALFVPDESGCRPALAGDMVASRDLMYFHEYFHGDSGAGLGATHQTGWTALVANLMAETGGPLPNS